MRKGFIFTVAVLAALAQPASAQQAEPQALRITASNVTAEATERETAPGVVLPGDVLEYELAFTNVQDFPIQDVVFTDPIPSGLVIQLGTASADRGDVVIDYSIDGAASWTATPTVRVEEAGQIVERPAPATAYTHVRWTVTDPIAPGATVTARFRASAAGNAGGGR